MTPTQAKARIANYFTLHSEAYSCCQEVTDNAVFTKKHVQFFDDETLVEVAEDLDYQLRIELGTDG